MQDVADGLLETYGPNKPWDKHKGLLCQESSQDSLTLLSHNSSRFPQTRWRQYIQISALQEIFPSAFFYPLFFLQTFEGDIFK